MFLKNNTEMTIEIVIKGTRLSIEPLGYSKELSEEQGSHWLSVHPFLVIGEEIAPGIPPVVTQELLDENPMLKEHGVEVGAEVREATVEEMAEVIRQVAPKPSAKKKAKK